MNMGLTAEYLAAKYRIPRGKQDEFALRSHQLAAEATDTGEFKDEIIPTWGRDESGHKVLLDPRPVHPPRYLARGPVGAAAGVPARGRLGHGGQQLADQRRVGGGLLIMSEEKARELGLKPMAKVRAMAVAGVNPEEMGIGPVPAVHKALKRAGLTLDQIDCIELNEAFAVQVLSVLKLLGIDEKGQHPRRRDRHRPPARRQRRPDRHHAAAPDARPGREARPGDDVRRPGAGRGDDPGELLLIVVPGD